jgi:sugar (pentulose or hexulose) kinase
MSEARDAAFLALDVTTTEFAVAVRGADGQEDYQAMPMRGGHSWRDDPAFPAFDLAEVPCMLQGLLAALENRGWRFQGGPDSLPRRLSVACRQHDQVVLDKQGTPLLPAISWQCNAATQDVAELKKLGVEQSVGTIEPRFVLPKLRCVLRHEPELAERIGTVFMTGDWIAYALTGEKSLSTSDALSNGLLTQSNRQLAGEAIRTAGLVPDWFPRSVQSGTDVGAVQASGESGEDAWAGIRRTLEGWRFVAGLGDNHASAVGCGMRADHRTLVVSGGTSGTINLSCPANADLPADGKSLQFEFYGDSLLLLLMLGDCGAWYNRFLQDFAAPYRHCLDDLNALALNSDLNSLRRVLHSETDHTESFPPTWCDAPLGEKVAATQFSIVLELLLRVKTMLEEVEHAGTAEVETFVLTGGLSQSPLFQQVFHTGARLLAPGCAVKVSGRTGPLRYKTSAYGALINAELPLFAGELNELHATGNRFPLTDCAPANPASASGIRYLLNSYGL